VNVCLSKLKGKEEMKFSLDAWIPPALVFGMVVASAVSSTHFVTAKSIDDGQSSLVQPDDELTGSLTVELSVDDETADPPAPPIAPPPPVALLPLVAPPAGVEPVIQDSLPTLSRSTVAVAPLATLPPIDVIAAEETQESPSGEKTRVHVLRSLPGAPAAPIAPAPPTVARVQEIRAVPSNHVFVPGMPIQEHRVNLQHGLFVAGEPLASSAKNQEFEAKAKQLVDQIRKSKVDEKTADLKAQLKDVTRQHFEYLESQRREQIQSLESKLSKLKELLEARSNNSDKIIERRISQLLGVPDAMDFYAESPTSVTSTITRLPVTQEFKVKGVEMGKAIEAARAGKEAKEMEIKVLAERVHEDALRDKAAVESKINNKLEAEIRLQKQRMQEFEAQIKELEQARMKLESARKQAVDAERRAKEAAKFQ
jgi:hypothetical protein